MQTGVFTEDISLFMSIYIYTFTRWLQSPFVLILQVFVHLCNIYIHIYIQMYHLSLQFNIFDNLTVFSTCVNVVL